MSNTPAGAQIPVQLQKLDSGLPTPRYAKHGDAGVDLYAAEDVSLAPGQRQLVPTGVAIALPHGFVGLLHPRSGLALRHGLSIVNTPGTIDAGYRGEIKVTLINTDRVEPLELKRGDRIAQLVIQPVVEAIFTEVERLPESERGDTGFGSSGGFANADKTVG